MASSSTIRIRMGPAISPHYGPATFSGSGTLPFPYKSPGCLNKNLTFEGVSWDMTRLTKLLLSTMGVAVLLAQPPGGPMQTGDGIWLRNAYFGEQETFDSCFGHQPGNGEYHHHVQPLCLRARLA